MRQTQDNLIQAYQKENEQLMHQLKKIQQGVKYDVHVQNEELRSQLKEAREQLGKYAAATDDGLPGAKANMGQYSLAVEARLKAEAHAIALQEELSAVRATHQEKENELKMALDRLKKAKVELECRYEGIDLEKMAEESLQMKKLERELDLKKKESEFALASLQKKLDWYVENQRLLDAQDDEVRRLKYQVTQLEYEAQRLRGEIQHGKTPGVTQSPSKHQTQSHHRSAADIRRIQELENRLVNMEEAMRKRHPDSLVNLILASRKAEDESKLQAMEDEYQRHMKAKEEEIEQIQEANETKLKSFRQQQEKLVLQFQKRIREQEKLLQKAGSHSHPKALQKRQINNDREVKDELKRVRNFYTEKIKDVERKWEMKYRSLRKQQYGAVESSSRDLQNLSYADSTIIITNLQRQLREQEAEMKKLTKQIQENQESATNKDHLYDAESNDGIQAGSENQLLQRKNEGLRDYVRNLESQLRASEEARSHLIQTLSTLQTFSAPVLGLGEPQSPVDDTVITLGTEKRLRAKIEQELTTKFDSEVESMKKMHQDELVQARQKISALEDQAREHLDAWGSVQIQLSEHLKEVHRLQQLLSEVEREKRALQELADKVPFLEGEVIRLQKQSSIPRTPSMLQYRSLEMKIETLTQKHLLREAELKVLLTKATQSSDLEKLQLERIHQNAIAAKNAEIRHFKKQLDEILDQLELLRESPGSMAP
uniref:Centrosomal protein of 162 kDa n=1 Tax=Globisporangium ultimum (strain ATCC 200006 / CBS 805.95 / DAOM BR144) TaxID=431595 RepID=K3WQE6_GLOUD